MASTYGVRVTQHIGAFADTASLDSWLTMAAKAIVDLLPKEKLVRYTTTLTDAGAGVTITGHRIIDAIKAGVGCRPIEVGNSGAAADSTSIHYATATDPIVYQALGKAYILPGGGSIYAVPYPTVLNTETAIVNFPPELDEAVVLKAAIQGAITNLQALTNPTAPTPPSAPSFAFGALAGPSVSAVTLDFITALATDYTAIQTAITNTIANVAAISTPTPPAAPVAPSFVYVTYTPPVVVATTLDFIAALSTEYTQMATAITNAITGVANITVPSPPSVPATPSFVYTTYAVPVVGAVTLDFITTLATDLTALGTMLDTNEDTELSGVKIQAIQEKIQQYIKQADLTMQKNLADAQASGENLKMKAASDLDASVKQYSAVLGKLSGDLDNYWKQIQQQVEGANANLNLMKTELEKVQSKIAQYVKQAELTSQKNVLDAQASGDNLKMKAASDLDAAIKQYSAVLQKFSGDLQSYVSQVEQQVKAAEANSRLTTVELQRTQTKIEQYVKQADLTLTKNLKDAEFTWDATKTKALKDFEAIVLQYTASIQKFTGQVSLYQVDVLVFQTGHSKWEKMVTLLQNEYLLFMSKYGVQIPQGAKA